MISLNKIAPIFNRKFVNLLQKVASTNSVLTQLQNRSIYSDDFLKLDNQKKYLELISSRGSSRTEYINKLKNAIETNSPIFKQDIDIALTGKIEDTDVDVLIKAVEKFENDGADTFVMSTPLVRTLYSANKLEKIKELFLKEEVNKFNQSYNIGFLLLNKLAGDKSYAEVNQVFNKMLANANANTPKLKRDGSQYPKLSIDALQLMSECIYEQKSIDAVKDFVQTAAKENLQLSPKTLTNLILVALKKGDFSYSLELTKKISPQADSIKHQLEAIIHSKSNHLDEAFASIVKLLETQQQRNLFVFKDTINALQAAISASKNPDPYKTKLDNLMSLVPNQLKISEMSVENFCSTKNRKRIDLRGESGNVRDSERYQGQRRDNSDQSKGERGSYSNRNDDRRGGNDFNRNDRNDGPRSAKRNDQKGGNRLNQNQRKNNFEE